MRLLAINDFPIRDSLDVAFHGAEEHLRLTVLDDGRRRRIEARKSYDESLGLDVEDFEIRKCNNNCVFCFIYQNPPGMRPTIYYKDGDFRMSFLHGNYITTTNLSDEDLSRIVEQRLSPQYVSVHATNPQLRNRMLGVKKSVPILERLQYFVDNGIQAHTQIVLCPGWNDGPELERTVRELAALGENLRTIAVVPLGLTEHRAGLPEMKPVTPALARETLALGERLEAETREGRSGRLLFFSDEWYLMAGAPWPDYRDVEDLEQLENGVGMLWSFYDGFKSYARKLPDCLASPARTAAFTGLLGAKALQPLAKRMRRVEGLTFDILPLENSLFGRGVTVSGLLPGRDFLRGIRENPGYDRYLIPGNALRWEDRVFLDDLTFEQLQRSAGAPVEYIEGGAMELAAAAIGGESPGRLIEAGRRRTYGY